VVILSVAGESCLQPRAGAAQVDTAPAHVRDARCAR